MVFPLIDYGRLFVHQTNDKLHEHPTFSLIHNSIQFEKHWKMIALVNYKNLPVLQIDQCHLPPDY